MKKAVLGIALLISALTVHAKILVDFGSDSSQNGRSVSGPDARGNCWNNPSSYQNNLVDVSGKPTGIGLYFMGNFGANGGADNGGLRNPDPALLGDFAVETATIDYYYCTPLDPGIGDTMRFKLTGLGKSKTYTLRFFASRAAGDTRVTTYTVKGGGDPVSTKLTTSGAGGNSNQVAVLSGLKAAPSGEIVIMVTAAPGSFGYISALAIEEGDVVIEDFDNWVPKGTPYVGWTNASLTAGKTGCVVSATDFGGVYDYLGTIDASGKTALRLTADVISGNAGFVVVLEDADGTVNSYAWYGKPVGSYVMTKAFNEPTQVQKEGKVPGLDISRITGLNVQIDDGAGANDYTVSFNDLSAVVSEEKPAPAAN